MLVKYHEPQQSTFNGRLPFFSGWLRMCGNPGTIMGRHIKARTFSCSWVYGIHFKSKAFEFWFHIFSSVSDHVSLIYRRPSSTRYSTTKSQSFQSQDTLRGSVSRSKTEGFISSSGKNRQHIADKRRCKTPASASAYTPIGESLEHNTRCYN